MPDLVHRYTLEIKSSAVSQPRHEHQRKQQKRLKEDLDLLLGEGAYELRYVSSESAVNINFHGGNGNGARS